MKCECGHLATDHKTPRPSLSPYTTADPAPGICNICACPKFKPADDVVADRWLDKIGGGL